MLRPGQRIMTLTKKVGQAPRTGVIIETRDEEFVTVEWDDGRTSTVSISTIVPAGKERAAKQ